MSSTTRELFNTTDSWVHDPKNLANFALSGLVSTIVLIMIGSFVRVSGNGLGCPDWPLCYGQAVPPLEYSAWVEFSHRLFGGIVAIQIGVVSLLGLINGRNRGWIKIPAVAAGLLLIFQVTLGGLHVLNELPRWTGLIHTGVAMALAGLLAVVVAETNADLLGLRRITALRMGSIPKWAILAAASTYILILSGSLVTRTGSSLVCPAFPHCGLSPIPAGMTSYVTIQMFHRFVAFSVAAILLIASWLLIKKGQGLRAPRRMAFALSLFVAIQIGLGIGNVLLMLPMWTRILHLGTAGIIWILATILAVSLRKNIELERLG